MSFQFPASKKEKQAAYDAMNELMQSIEAASSSAQKALEALEENFVAMDEDCIKKFTGSYEKLSSRIWELKVAHARMQINSDRIIKLKDIESFDFVF
jgi:superfamily II RNA helicase